MIGPRIAARPQNGEGPSPTDLADHGVMVNAQLPLVKMPTRLGHPRRRLADWPGLLHRLPPPQTVAFDRPGRMKDENVG